MEHTIQSALAKLNEAQWIAVIAARVLIGIFFCISGGPKLLVPSHFAEMQQTMIQSHIPFPHASALFVSFVEFACGGGLVLGLLTPLCALMLMVNMIVAILTNRIGSIHASGFLAWLDDFLYLPEVLYVVILFWLLFSGPGPYSVDSVIARSAVSHASTGH
jgi:putative oxidoreductase